VAVAQALEKLHPGVEVLFVGTDRGLEARVVPALGYELRTIDVRFLKGTGALGWAKGLAKLPMAGVQASQILWGFKPHLVVSVGGYAAGPITMLAASLGFPTALMEQNALPGITNRLLGKVVDRCFLSLPDTKGLLPKSKCTLTGNPLRREILAAIEKNREKRVDGEEFRIFVTGGSGGAGPLNLALPGAFRKMPEALCGRLVIRHQAGRGRSESVWDAYRGFAGKVDVVEFIEDMPEAYHWADLVVCRLGATTLAELLVLGQPSVLIPFAGAADNHQEENALAVEKEGAAVVVRETELEGERLCEILSGLANHPESLTKMGARAQELGNPEAAQLVAEKMMELVGRAVETERAAEWVG
jgi:UDP-N-acetylglucosamine--N-acetylmuramyl-(pentapeptide) pyrophosphoryl-undecaprenol N-acetylglucosamine transferase